MPRPIDFVLSIKRLAVLEMRVHRP